MEVTVKLNSILKRHCKNPEGKVKMTVEEGTTIKEVLKKLSLIEGETGVVILNSKLALENTVLNDGDVLELYPVVGGG